jgi:DNA polymerase III delta prime subunit
VSFYLRERQPVELVKVRLQGQQLLALREDEEYDPLKNTTDDGGGQRRAKVAALGAYQKITYLEGDERRQKGNGRWQLRKPGADSDGPSPRSEKLAVEVRLTEERRSKVDEDSVTASFPDAGELMVDVSGELASVRSQRDAIERLEQGKAVNLSVADWIFDSQKARVPELASPVEATDARLNDGQRQAVAKALVAPDVFFLQGPPGTGKTTVIAELCRQMVKQGKRTLIASQANLAVDNALGSLYPAGRPSPELRPLRELDSRRGLDMDDAYKVFLPSRIVPHWLLQVANACDATLKSTTSHDDRWAALKRAWIDRLRNGNAADNGEEMRQLYKHHANVIGATCNRTGRKDFYQSTEFDPSFDLVVVDEVSKATPPELLMPLLLGRRSILVGDHRQLPPVFRSESFEEAVANEELKAEMLANFGKMVSASLFEELFITAPDALRGTLREQYRMHPHIMHAVNHFYPDKHGKGILVAGGGEKELHERKQHGLSVNGTGTRTLLTSDQHVLWLDSASDERGQPVAEGAKRGTSRWNPFEIELIEGLLHQIDDSLASNQPATNGKLDVGVISFYLAQTNELRERVGSKCRAGWRHLNVQVNTVDQFQGRECSVVIVSLVRAGEVSGEFVKDYRRINVAFSRAKNLLVIVGSRSAFMNAAVPICPVEGGEPDVKKVYQEIAKQVIIRGGLRDVSHVLKQTQTSGTHPHSRNQRR